MNSIGYFEIQSSDPQREVKFYGTLFGWTFVRNEHVPIEYYQVETKTIRGGLLKRPAKEPMPEMGTNAFTCSVEVDDFDRVSDLVLANGGRVAMAKFAIPGRCWQGYFLDADNNVFGLFQPDTKAGL